MRLLTCALLNAITMLVISVAAPHPVEARRSGRTSFRDKTAGIQIALPRTWKRQTRSAFPGVLVTFKHQTHDARFLLAARRRSSGQTLMALARQNVAVLKARKWTVGAITATRLGKIVAVEFVATDPTSTQRVRQLYAVRGKFAFVMTLVAPLAQSVRLHADFLFVQKSARFAR